MMENSNKKKMLIKVLDKFTHLCTLYIGGGLIISLTVLYLGPDLPPVENPPECNARLDLLFISAIFVLLANLVSIFLTMVSALLQSNSRCTMLFYVLWYMVLALPSVLTIRGALLILSCGSQFLAVGAALSLAMTLVQLYLLSSLFLTYTEEDVKVVEEEEKSHRTNVELPLQADDK